jgi:hypothetical protein
MKFFVILFTLFFFSQPFFADNTVGKVAENESTDLKGVYGADDLEKAYRVLIRTGNYEEKKKALIYFKKNYQSERVVAMIVDLISYYYDDPLFKENNQIMYYDDVVAEELVKLLGKNGNYRGFPALLKVVLYSDRHRETTVKESWNAIKSLKW